MARRSLTQYDEFKQSVLSDPESKAEYEYFKLQLELADKMKTLRKIAELTQDDIAEKMQTTKSSVARIEAAGGRGKHSPSLKTLAKYANALGYNLEITSKRAN